MKKIILIASLTTITLCLQAQKINLSKGAAFESVGTSTMNMEVMGQATTMESTATILTDTKEVSDTGFLFSNTTKRMVMKIEGAGQHIHFDSDKKEDREGPMGSSMKDIIGSVQGIRVNKQGKVTGLTENNDNPGHFTDAMNMAGQIVVGMSFYMLVPQNGKTMTIGDAWIDSSSADAMQSVFQYKLKNITATDITIEFDGKVSLNQTPMGIILQGTTKGEAVYDPQTGFLKNNRSVNDFSGNMGSQTVHIKGNAMTEVKRK